MASSTWATKSTKQLKKVTLEYYLLEIIEYAKYLGIDIETEQDLLWIAMEGVRISKFILNSSTLRYLRTGE